MAEELEEVATEETEASESEETVEEELEEVDVNISLLEAMIQRTEIIEKLAKEAISASEATRLLAEVAVPTLKRRRRRRK